MKRFNKIYITVDIDALDPAYAPGTGTPQFGGLGSRELLDLLYELFKLPVIGFDVVEVAPGLEQFKTAVFAARKIITECWGQHYRKGLNLSSKEGMWLGASIDESLECPVNYKHNGTVLFC